MYGNVAASQVSAGCSDCVVAIVSVVRQSPVSERVWKSLPSPFGRGAGGEGGFVHTAQNEWFFEPFALTLTPIPLN
jgi:hypothetical protein